jgi:ssDNA-binding Zn-finger/Zn-ribbon topoisomerase 1
MTDSKKVYCDECLLKDIESEMVQREGMYGDFYGCSRYPECKYTLNERQYNLAYKEQND